MKKVRTEKVVSNINDYLKKRNFESSGNSLGRVLAEHQVGMMGLVSPAAPNSFTFSSTSAQHTHIDHQYVRLKSWMTEASEPCRSELSQVLFPLFIHLYLELVAGSGRQAASRFFKRHYQVFMVNRDYEHMLSQVVAAAGDMNNSPVIQNLKSGKYLVRISELTLNYFLRYLKASDNPTLLQIFNTYIEVEVEETGGGGANLRGPMDHSGLPNGHTPDIAMSTMVKAEGGGGADCSDEDLRRVKEVVGRTREVVPSCPSLCLYSVANAYNGLSAARVNPEGALLACGFEDSVVKLWRLTPPSPRSKLAWWQRTRETKDSHSLLACDFSRIDDLEEKDEKVGCQDVQKEEEDSDDEDDNCEDDEQREKCSQRSDGSGGGGGPGGEMWALRGHSGPVLDVAFTHDSSHVITVSEDTTMRLWDVGAGRAVALYRGHTSAVWGISVAPHSLYLCTASYDNTARLWTTDCIHPLRTLSGHTRAVDCTAFHPNSNYLSSGSSDRSVRLWQVNDGSVARILLHHKAPINALQFAPNGKYLASGAEDGAVVVWDLAAGRPLCELPRASNSGLGGGHGDAIVSLSWTLDSSRLVSASADGLVRCNLINGTATSSDTWWEMTECGQVLCCGAGGSGTGPGGVGNGVSGTLVHLSLTTEHYLAAVAALDVER